MEIVKDFAEQKFVVSLVTQIDLAVVNYHSTEEIRLNYEGQEVVFTGFKYVEEPQQTVIYGAIKISNPKGLHQSIFAHLRLSKQLLVRMQAQLTLFNLKPSNQNLDLPISDFAQDEQVSPDEQIIDIES